MFTKRDTINSRQIRAARALLDWSQDDLAEHSGLSIATIRKIESGSISPRDKTMGSIIDALEAAKIDFTPSQGVCLKSNEITVFEGEDSYLRLLDDIFHTLKSKGGERLISYADETVSPEEVIHSELRMRKAGIKFRCLIEENDTYMYFPTEEYRWVPKKFFRNNVQEIYGNKVAMSLYPNMTSQVIKGVIIIESAPLADAMRNAFNFMWENCRKPTFTTAPEVYK